MPSLPPRSEISRRSLLISATALALGGVASAAAPFLAGCGGSSHSSGSNSTRSAPTSTTKTRVATLLSTSMRTSVSAGFGPANLASAATLAVANGSIAAPAASPSTDSISSIGAFLRNVATVAPKSRAAARHRAAAKYRAVHRDEATPTPSPSPTSDPDDPGTTDPPVLTDPAPSFYYDYYLGLWVQINDTDTQSTYTLYVDEAKTQAAGSIVTTWPASWDTYPQVWQSTYSFTAGYQAGSHGSSVNTTNSDGSGSADYNDTYTDGWSDSGSSTWSGAGDYTYQSQTTASDSSWTKSSGSWYANGSGGSRYSTSEGYAADYVYSADGSGHGTITGPDPGLPVTVSWDAYGNTTIHYADGTVETIPGWGYYSDGGDSNSGGVVTPVAVSNGPVATGY